MNPGNQDWQEPVLGYLEIVGAGTASLSYPPSRVSNKLLKHHKHCFKHVSKIIKIEVEVKRRRRRTKESFETRYKRRTCRKNSTKNKRPREWRNECQI